MDGAKDKVGELYSDGVINNATFFVAKPVDSFSSKNFIRRRVSSKYVSEDARLHKYILDNCLTDSDRANIGEEILRRYIPNGDFEYRGKVGYVGCHQALITSDIYGDDTSYLLKYMNMDEVWKNVFYEDFLLKNGLSEWCSLTDWGPYEHDKSLSFVNSNEKPFYIVMKKGKTSGEALRTIEGLEDVLDAIGSFYFNSSNKNIIKDIDASVTKRYIDTLVLSLDKYVSDPAYKGLVPEDLLNKTIISNLREHLYSNIKYGVTYYYTPVLPDLLPENIIWLDGELRFIDQGYKIDLVRALHNDHPDAAVDSKDLFLGSPHAGLGKFNFGLQMSENIPGKIKDFYISAVKRFVNEGRFYPRTEKKQILGKKVWSHEQETLSANLVMFGQFKQALYQLVKTKESAWGDIAKRSLSAISNDYMDLSIRNSYLGKTYSDLL